MGVSRQGYGWKAAVGRGPISVVTGLFQEQHPGVLQSGDGVGVGGRVGQGWLRSKVESTTAVYKEWCWAG